jgi:demethylspheroidene O-methyltransferase
MTLAGTAIEQRPLPAAASAGTIPGTLRDRALSVRDRIVSAPAFQRWAARLPGVRWIAHRRARALFDLCAGFAYSQTLSACVRLDLLDFLAERPRDVDELAAHTSLPRESVVRLLKAAEALQLVSARSGGTWGLGSLGAPMLAMPGLSRMVEHNALLYEELRDPVALLRRGAGADTSLTRYYPYADQSRAGAGLQGAEVAEYSTLMASTVGPVAQEVLDAVSLGRHRRLLDIGGGEGVFAATAAARWPALEVGVFDLPAVAARARRRLSGLGLDGRAQVYAGDFRSDPLPTGADVISLVRICLDHDDDTVRALLARVRAVLPRGGRLIVAEPFAGARGAESVGDVYFGLYLWAMGRGRARRARELCALLAEAGFRRPRALPTDYPIQTGVIVADG